MSKFLNAAKAITISMLKLVVIYCLVRYGRFLGCLLLGGLVLAIWAFGLRLDLVLVPVAVLVVFFVVWFHTPPPENPRRKSKKPGD
ncbi:MAG TPA: hypothetical protein VFS27_00720 [Blastocatellia bacterium]|jgi:hypothetical protein|nr:hypothetical protein [Blastocatellia bacterium]